MTSDTSYPKDRDVKAFIDGHKPPFVIEKTDIGSEARAKRKAGGRPKKNAGELTIVDFMTSDDGVPIYVATGEPVAILFEDAGVRVFNKPPNLHLLSTVGMLLRLERVGVIVSADKIIHEMTHPSKWASGTIGANWHYNRMEDRLYRVLLAFGIAGLITTLVVLVLLLFYWTIGST